MNIRFDMAQVVQAIDALLGLYPELREDEVLRADTFEAETDLHKILVALLNMSQEAKFFNMAIDDRIEELSERGKRYERRAQALRDLMQCLMEKADLQKLTLPEATLSISYRKPAPFVADEAQLPDEFCKFKRSPDMAKIKEAGTLPPGCSMSNGKNVLTVRVK